MRRLTGLDANFLYAETPRAFLHTLKIAELADTGPEDTLLARFRAALEARVHLLPGFTSRVMFVPLGLAPPVLAPDPDFSIARHVQLQRVPFPGDRAARDRVIATIAAAPLPRDRPLWAMTLLTGLEHGRVCCVTRLHHALGDGLACARMLERVARPSPEPAPPRLPTPLPRRRQLLSAALRDRVPHLRALPGLTARTLRALAARGERPPSLVFGAPRTRFNRALSPGRSFASARLPLDALREVARRLGVKLNAVLLGLVSAALHGVLEELGEAPRRPLLASVPLGVVDARTRGNHLSNLITSLCTDRADLPGRIQAIAAVTRQVRADHAIVGAGAMRAWAEYTPALPFAWLLGLYSRWKLADRHRPPVNLIVSNVRGPAEPLTVAGARVTGLTSVGPILDGIGLNVTAWSYAGQLELGLLADDTCAAPLAALAAGLLPALEGLHG